MIPPAVVKPLPDEMLEGFLGRVSIVNGVGSLDPVFHENEQSEDCKKYPYPVQLAAIILQQEPADVLLRYTTIPACRPFFNEPRLGKVAGQKKKGVGFPRKSAVAAFACRRCIELDARSGGPSYWRRRHHLPTIDWCPDHGEPLIRFDRSAFCMPPSEAMAKQLGEVSTSFYNALANPALQRLTQILMAWLDQSKPLSSALITQVVQDKCAEKDLRVGQIGKRLTATDVAREIFPLDWLKIHWPDVIEKRKGDFIVRLDGVAKSRFVAYSGAACALMLSTLFDSAQEALDSLKSPQVFSEEIAIKATLRDFMKGTNMRTACINNAMSLVSFETWLRREMKSRGIDQI